MMRIMIADKGEQALLLLYGHCDDMLVLCSDNVNRY